jgi:hypothetical protein
VREDVVIGDEAFDHWDERMAQLEDF